MQFWYLIPICLLFTGLLIAAEWREAYRPAVLFKALASLSFVILGVLAFRQHSGITAAVCFMAGLILGAIGDVLLNVCHLANESQIIFLAGGLAFFAGHIFYLIALIPLAGSFVIPAVGAGILAAALVLFFLFRKRETTMILKLEAGAYLIAVSLMASFSVFNVVNWLSAGGPEGGRILRAFGGMLFLISDTLLFYRTVSGKTKNKWLVLSVLVTYYPAQCLIAASMQFLN